MGVDFRVPLGILGNAASLFLYTVPILTFRRVVRERSTEEFSCVPYVVTLLNCLLYTWFGLPVVSRGWENLTVATINGVGIVLEAAFVSVYVRFASAKRKKLVCLMVLLAIALFSATALLSSFAFHDHPRRKVFAGSIGLVASISMYGSPLVAMRLVVKSKSVEFMPFYLSFFSFLSSVLWMAYGLLGKELFIAAPNFLGVPLGLLQLVVYCIYRKNKGGDQQQAKVKDVEKSGVP